MSFESLVEQALADPLAVARESRAIGYVGIDVPIELILAAGKQPLRLRGRSGASTARADRFVEESFSAATRHIAEQWLAGELDPLEAVVFSRSDDSAQRLYYYICELQRTGQCAGPTPLLFDVALLPRASSAAHTLDSTRALANALGTSAERLPQAIAQVERRRDLIERLDERRTAGAVRGSFAHRVRRALECRWTEDFDRAFEEWLDTLRPTSVQRRLVLVGSEPSDEQLHEAMEAAGASVVGEINEASFLDAAMPNHDDPLVAIAVRSHRLVHDARSNLCDSRSLAERLRALQADAAVLWLLATDTGLAWEAPRIERALRDAGCAVLELVLQRAEPDAEALSRIERFARTLEVL